MNRRISIYEIRFEDGHVYVGQSVHVEQRIADHKTSAKKGKSTNRGLKALFDEEVPYKVVEVAGFYTQREADFYETERIRKVRRIHGDLCVNRQDGPLKGVLNGEQVRTRAAISGKELRCSWCRKNKSYLEFNADSSRSSGFASRCVKCVAFMGQCSRSIGATSAEGYALARRVFSLDAAVSAAAEKEYLERCAALGLKPYPADPPSGGGKLPRSRPPRKGLKIADRGYLRELFVARNMTPQQIAEKESIHHVSVYKYLRLHGFRKRGGYSWTKEGREATLKAGARGRAAYWRNRRNG